MRELTRHFGKILNSKTVDEFEDNFAAFLAAGRTITLALQKDNKKNQNFKIWYTEKQNEMREDELCKYFKDTRDIDLHTGDSEIRSSYHIEGTAILSAGPNETLAMTPRGAYEIKNLNTPQQELKQISLGRVEKIKIFLENPPQYHKGLIIEDKSPISICKLFQTYLSDLILEAKEKFPDTIII